MDKTLLGQILATVITAAVDAGLILANAEGVVTDPVPVGDMVRGFTSIWKTHPASGIPQATAPIRVGAAA